MSGWCRLVALAVALLALPPAAGVASARAHRRPRPRIFLANARLPGAGSARHRPRTCDVSGDGSFTIARIAWRRYDGAVATGRGTARINTCRPSCFRGRIRSYPVGLRASRVRTAGGRRYYTRLQLTYGRRHPGRSRRRVLNVAPLPRPAKASVPNASSLARGVTTARTSPARQRALLAVARGLGVGVYTGTGRQVVGGFERGPQSVYLYDFEIRALAGQLARGRLSSFDDLAAGLNAAGVTLNGHRLTGAALAAATARGIARLHGRATTPEAALGLTIRDLGLARHVDLATPQAADQPLLDPLQAVLLTVDLARGSAVSSTRAAAASVPYTAYSGDGCEGGNFFGAAGNGAIGLSIVTGRGIGPRAIITKEVVDGLHGVALAYSFEFTEVQKSLTGAFGESGPHSATPMLFQVQATLLDGAGSANVKCGALAGQKPAVQGIPVSWNPDAVSHLEYLGAITCQAGCQQTGPDGVATLAFKPDDEYLPGVGPTIIQHGTVAADAHPQQAAGNILGSVAEALGFTKEAAIGWEISFHDPPGYRIDIPSYTFTWDFGNGASQTSTSTFTDMEDCSRSPELPHPTVPGPTMGASDPRSNPASTWHAHVVVTGNGQSTSYDTQPTSPADIPMTADPSFPVAFPTAPPQPYGDGSAVSGQWQFAGSTLHAIVTAKSNTTPPQPPLTPGQQTFDLPVTEARGCPQVLGR